MSGQLSLLLAIFLLPISFLLIWGGVQINKKEGEKGKKILQNFENKMNDRGFTKRLIVYDFLQESNKQSVNHEGFNGWTVGISLISCLR